MVTANSDERPPIFGLADLSSQFERDDVSTYRKGQKHTLEMPKQSSTSSLPNSAIRLTSLMRAAQTFQQATQGQTLRLCPNPGWPRHSSNKLANTRRNPALLSLAYNGGIKAAAKSSATFTLRKSPADNQRRSCSPKTRQEGSRLTLRSRRSYCGSLWSDWPFDKTRVPAVMNF